MGSGDANMILCLSVNYVKRIIKSKPKVEYPLNMELNKNVNNMIKEVVKKAIVSQFSLPFLFKKGGFSYLWDY